MNLIIAIFAAISMSLISTVSISADEIGECASAAAIDHASERQCLERAAARANDEMIKAENRVIRALQRWDQDQHWRDKALKDFKRAAKAFRAYQEQHCNFEASTAAGGNAAGDLRAECIYRLAKERIKLLLEQEKNLTN